MIRADYIAERRKATRRLNAEIRATPEFAAMVAEAEAYCSAHTEWLAHAQVFNHTGEFDNGQK